MDSVHFSCVGGSTLSFLLVRFFLLVFTVISYSWRRWVQLPPPLSPLPISTAVSRSPTYAFCLSCWLWPVFVFGCCCTVLLLQFTWHTYTRAQSNEHQQGPNAICLFANTISIWRQITGSKGSRYGCQCPGSRKGGTESGEIPAKHAFPCWG